jgi:transposase-like protein
LDLARFVVDAVVLEGRSYRDVARAHGVNYSETSSWIRHGTIKRRASGEGVHYAPRHPSTMPRDITNVPPAGFEPAHLAPEARTAVSIP